MSLGKSQSAGLLASKLSACKPFWFQEKSISSADSDRTSISGSLSAPIVGRANNRNPLTSRYDNDCFVSILDASEKVTHSGPKFARRSSHAGNSVDSWFHCHKYLSS